MKPISLSDSELDIIQRHAEPRGPARIPARAAPAPRERRAQQVPLGALPRRAMPCCHKTAAWLNITRLLGARLRLVEESCRLDGHLYQTQEVLLVSFFKRPDPNVDGNCSIENRCQGAKHGKVFFPRVPLH